MEIGKFKLAKADLVRPPNKPAQEQIIPKQKPYTEKVFKLEVDDFIKGFIGGFPKDEMLLKIQSVLDKAVDAGAIEPQEGIKYLKERKQQLVDFARENYGQELPDIEEDRKEFSLGTEKPITLNNDFSNIQVADLKDDLTPGPLKDELDGKYDPSQETYEEYLQRKNLDRPFNASLEESTTGPGGYPMTASILNLPNLPKTAKQALDLFEAGKVGIRDATKITKDFFNRADPYGGAERIGTATKKDREKDKDFLKVFNKLKNKFFQGNVTKTNKELGLSERFARDLEQRIFKSEKGTRKVSNEDRFLFYEPSVPEPTKGMSYTETTSLMKKDPNKFLDLKVDKENPNRFLDRQSLSNYLGIKFEKDKTGKLTQLGKTQSDALVLQLRNLGVKKTNQGLFDVNDAINKLVKKSESKLIKGERKSDMGAGRYNLEKKFDPELFQVRNLARDRVLKRSKGLDVYLPNAVDNAGHPYSLSKSEEKYKKLFKNSNINKINTLVYQDPLINKELFKTSGYESKYDKMFDKLSKIQNKKITPEIQEQLLKIKNDLNQNYNYVKNIIKSPNELKKYLPKDTDPKFINYLSKTQGDRVQKIDIDIPKVGETFKSENIFVDMSSVDPKYILGYINNINPNAKKFKDLSLAEQRIYKDNLLLQNSEIVSDFYKKSGYTGEEVEEVREAITMPFAEGGRAKFNEGKLAKVGNVVGKTFAGLDVPAMQGLFATGYQAGDDPLWYTIPAALTETANRYLNLYEKSPGKAKNFIKSVLRLMPIEQAKKFYPVFSKLGKVGSTTGYPFFKAASEALKEIKVRGETERAAADFKMSPQKMKELRSLSIKRANLPRFKDDDYVPTKQDYSEANKKIQEARDAFILQAKIIGSAFGLTEDPLAEKESIYTRGQQVPMSLERVQEGSRSNLKGGTEVPVVTVDDKIDELISFYQDYLKQGGKMNFMTFAKKYIPQNFATGGRAGFADGPENPKKGLGSFSKRNFLKTLALIPAGIMAIKGGPNLLKKAKPAVEAIKNAPPHFLGLVNKIRALGRIVDPKKTSYIADKNINNIYDYGDYRMIESKDGGIAIKKDNLMATDYGDATISEEYMQYSPGKIDKKTGKKIEDDYYEENTSYADQDGELRDVEEGVLDDTINEGTYSKEELEQLIIEQVEQNLKKGKK